MHGQVSGRPLLLGAAPHAFDGRSRSVVIRWKRQFCIGRSKLSAAPAHAGCRHYPTHTRHYVLCALEPHYQPANRISGTWEIPGAVPRGPAPVTAPPYLRFTATGRQVGLPAGAIHRVRLLLCSFQNLAIFVVPALGARTMRQLALVAIRAFRERGDAQVIMRAAR